MGLEGVTTIGREGELSVEGSRPLVLLLRDALSVSLSEAVEDGREIVRTEEVRRMTLPMRADHLGLGLELLITEWTVVVAEQEDGKDQKQHHITQCQEVASRYGKSRNKRTSYVRYKMKRVVNSPKFPRNVSDQQLIKVPCIEATPPRNPLRGSFLYSEGYLSSASHVEPHRTIQRIYPPCEEAIK